MGKDSAFAGVEKRIVLQDAIAASTASGLGAALHTGSQP